MTETLGFLSNNRASCIFDTIDLSPLRKCCRRLLESLFSQHGRDYVTFTLSAQTTDTCVLFGPFDAHCCHTGTAVKHPVPDRVKWSFVIFDIRALWRSALGVRVSGCQNYKWRSGTVCFVAVPIWQQWALKGLRVYCVLRVVIK